MSKVQELLYNLAAAEEITLPSGGKATVLEMTGNEQRNFMNRTKIFNGMAAQELLAACTESVNGVPLPTEQKDRLQKVTSLLSGDRGAILFGIRRHSIGDEFRFEAECSECKNRESWEVDLADPDAFKITPYKLGDQRAIQYDSTVRPGLTFKFTLLDGVAEMEIMRHRASADMLTDLEMRSPHVLEDKEADKWIRVSLSKLPDSLLGEMRSVVREHEGSIDTTVKLICANCEAEVKFDLIQIPDFMTPNVTY